MGFQIRESVLDVPEEELILELEKEASCPHIMAIGRTPLLVRSANMLRKQAKYIAELEKTLEQIREGCQNVKEDVGGNNEQIRALATLVIRDCNLTLKKAQEK